MIPFCSLNYQVREEVSPVLMTVIACLVPILHHAEVLFCALDKVLLVFFFPIFKLIVDIGILVGRVLIGHW